MNERIAAYFLLAAFFLTDFLIRKDKTAKSVTPTTDDNKSTMLILLTFFVVLILSAILNASKLGQFTNSTIARTGLCIMLAGIVIRMQAMITLSKYYTRTLLAVRKQELISSGLYTFIRHPGYLGTILIWSAAGLAMQNKIIFIIASVLVLIAYYYRIIHEEKMLLHDFGDAYAAYQKKSWRLLPLIW